MRRGVGKICDFQPIRHWQSKIGEIGGALRWVQVKHYTYLAAGNWLCFTGLSLKL